MFNPIDVQTSADQIVRLERGALDRWGRSFTRHPAFQNISPEASEGLEG
jgi:hypothetical protein